MYIFEKIEDIVTPLPNNSVIKADCFDVFPHLKSESVDLILCDLPYGTTKAKWDTPIDLPTLWGHYERIIKPNGAILLFAQTPFDKVLGCSNLKMLRYEWIWEKTQATGGMNSKKMPMKAHENILVFYKKSPLYNPQKTQGHVRKVSSAKNRASCIDRRNQKEDYIYNKEYAEKVKDYDSTERYPRDVLKFKTDKQKSSLHPTQKPVELLKYFIKTYTNEGMLVLDNTAGSGSTGEACKETNRDFILIEKENIYFETIIKRLASN